MVWMWAMTTRVSWIQSLPISSTAVTVISHWDPCNTPLSDSLLLLWVFSTRKRRISPRQARAGLDVIAGSRCCSVQHKHVLEPRPQARPLCDPDRWKTETRPTLNRDNSTNNLQTTAMTREPSVLADASCCCYCTTSQLQLHCSSRSQESQSQISPCFCDHLTQTKPHFLESSPESPNTSPNAIISNPV